MLRRSKDWNFLKVVDFFDDTLSDAFDVHRAGSVSGSFLSGESVGRRASEFCDEGGEEVRGGGARGGELRFQSVHQGHQLIHFGHDPALFGERWEWDPKKGLLLYADLVSGRLLHDGL